MVRDVAFGQYFPANSVIHKCDPRAKLIMLVGFLVIIFCTFNYASLALVVLFTALFVAASKVPAKFYFKSMKVIIFIIIVTSILNVFYGSGDPLVQWGIFKITLNGINRAIFVSVRIICLILASSCLTFTTSPTELTDAIERLMKPLAKLHFPVHEIAMMMSLALRFVPTLLEETDKITQAQKARGADISKNNLIVLLKCFQIPNHIRSRLIPLVGILFHGVHDDFFQSRRNIGIDISRTNCCILHMHHSNGDRIICIKRLPTSQHLIEHNTNGI